MHGQKFPKLMVNGGYISILLIIALVLFSKILTLNPLDLSDFCAYYLAGKLALIREFGFEQSSFARYQDIVGLGRDFKPELLELPPHAAIFTAPFALLTPAVAYYVRWLFCLSAGIAGVYLLWHPEKKFRQKIVQVMLLVLGLASSIAHARTVVLAQPTWLIVGIMCAYCYSLLGKRELSAAVFFTFSSIKLQYAPFLGIGAVICKRWKLVALSASIIIVETIFCGFWFGWGNTLEYPAFIKRVELDPDPRLNIMVNTVSMISARGLLSLLFDQTVALPLSGVFTVLGLAACTYAWYCASKRQDEAIKWALAFSILISLVSSAHVHLYDAMLVVVPAILTLDSLDPFHAAYIKQWSLKLWSLTLIFYPLLPWLVFWLDVTVLHLQIAGLHFSVITILSVLLLDCILSFLAFQNLINVPLKSRAQ